MTNDQKIRLRLSKPRGRLQRYREFIEDLTDETRSEAKALHTELNDLSIRERAEIPSETHYRNPRYRASIQKPANASSSGAKRA